MTKTRRKFDLLLLTVDDAQPTTCHTPNKKAPTILRRGFAELTMTVDLGREGAAAVALGILPGFSPVAQIDGLIF
jgi:hypothetical protein